MHQQRHGRAGRTDDGVPQLNFESLSQDMAQGHGEHLAALATLMGVSPDRQSEFFSLAQAKYVDLIADGETTPRAMLAASQDVMAGHPVLAEIPRR